ncbi:hypothetical protein EYF80_025560 [Liparis tanakae]|uniref:Uncharacterized protein n=1 Tax=Liparis tanakae TaxID=230148 RepID=A0A4Z2HH80_9TELE|nr:hypothetical protein EYF80_025560 [Liparis tanakae]
MGRSYKTVAVDTEEDNNLDHPMVITMEMSERDVRSLGAVAPRSGVRLRGLVPPHAALSTKCPFNSASVLGGGAAARRRQRRDAVPAQTVGFFPVAVAVVAAAVPDDPVVVDCCWRYVGRLMRGFLRLGLLLAFVSCTTKKDRTTIAPRKANTGMVWPTSWL